MASQGPLTPGRKPRRSWFDTPPLMSLDPKPAQNENARPKKPKRLSIDTVETLTLTHFTSAPRLGFGNAIVGSTKFRTLIIRNPHDFEQEVIIEKFPFKKKFYVDHTRFEVAPGDVFSLEIIWTPEEATSVREMVQFYINGVYRLQCYLFGTAENPKPVRKVRRRKFCPPVCENSDVIQTPALARIKSNYNPRRSQELRDVQALVENKEFHHNNTNAKKAQNQITFGNGKKIEKCKSSPSAFENQENVFVRPNPIVPVTPTVFESTSIGMRHDEEESSSSSQQTQAKWKKITSVSAGGNDDTLMAMSPIPIVSDGSENGMTFDSFFRPSEMGVKDERPSNACEYRMKDTFVVPKAPLSQLESDFPACPTGLRPKDNQLVSDGKCLSSTVLVSSNDYNVKENTYSIANGAFSLESNKSKGIVESHSISSNMSPSSTLIEFSKRVEWQSPQKAGTLNHSSDLSSMSPNTILDQSLSFISQVSTPVKNQRNNFDMDVSGNSSLISTGHGLVSPNSFMEEMKSAGQDVSEMIDNHRDNSIPSPSSVFNNSIPHNLMIKHLDNINVSLLNNSPFSQPRPFLKANGGKRRSLTTVYRVAEKKKSQQVKKSPPKSRDSRDRRENSTANSVVQNKGNGIKRAPVKRNSPVKRSMKVMSFRKSPLNKHYKQKMKRSPGGKNFSPKVLRSKRHMDCNTPVKQSPKIIDSGTVVKNQSSNSFVSPSVVDPGHTSTVSPKFTSNSPRCLPMTPGDNTGASSRRSTLTVTKSRPSDALLTAMNNNRKKLFDQVDGGEKLYVHFDETSTNKKNNDLLDELDDNDTMELRQECEKLELGLTLSPSNQFCSPTHQNLPNSPKPENSRRSTHVVRSPKVLDLSSIQQKRLNFNTDEPTCGDGGSSSYNISSLEDEVKSKQNSPITSVCVMSPQVVDYEITSDEGSTSRQSVSIDSLDTSQCGTELTVYRDGDDRPGAVGSTSVTGFECENRVDVLNDTRPEDGVTFTSLKTPNKDLDWSFCERGDTKVLLPKMDIASNEIDETASAYGISADCAVVAEPKQLSGACTHILEESRQGMIKKKKLRRSVSAHEIHSPESGHSHDLTHSKTVDVSCITQDDMSKTVVTGERKLRQTLFCDSSNKSQEYLKGTTRLGKMSNTMNESRQLRSNKASEKEQVQAKNLGTRSQSLNNISHNSYGTHVISGSKGRCLREQQVKAPKPNVVKNTDTNLLAAKTGVNKPKKLKGQVKGVAQSKLILVKKAKNAVPRHPMPFAARNMYYDERWMEKQENGFVQWLNFVLTPPDEYVTVTSKPKVDAVALTLGNQQGVPTRLAPTKEVLSFRAYAARRRLNRLRRAACQLYQSDQVAGIIRKIEVEVESQRIAARKDRMLHADLGIKQRVLDLLLQYSSLWLRVGLETVFGEVLPLHSNTDVVGLSRFIVTRLLSCPDIAAQYAHPSVPHLYTEGFAAAMSRHTVKKFLLLIYFMDRAKTVHLIDHDPCLFCKDADIKSSKEILIQFSREVLSGEGDLTRHLAYLGYTVCQVQKPFDEFDYAVSNISSDLKDGLRLSRLLELLAGDSCIMRKLRTPAISRLQKIHNMEVFFSAMTKRGMKLDEMSGTTARDVVDGHREKTLSMLWHLILHFQANLNVDEEKLKEEINLLVKSLQLKLAMQKIGAAFTEDCLARRDSGESTTFVNNERMHLIFRWCRLVCLHYGVKIENMTVSFSDGRALCCLLHHYHPVLLPLSDIRFQTTQQFQEAAEEVCDGDDPDLSVDWGKRGGLCPNEDDPAHFEKLLANERSNFKVLYEKVSALGGVPLMVKHTHMSNTIPDEKVVTTYVSYLCLRLLDIREEVKAARVIQMAWRRRRLQKTFKERLWAAQIIQKWYRKYLVSKREKERQVIEETRCKMESAATKLQAACRGYLERRRLKCSKAVIVLQSFWRMKKAQNVVAEMRLEIEQKEREEMFRRETRAALTIQTFYRGYQVREDLKHVKKCALILQSLWRMRKAKQRVVEIRLETERKEMEESAAVTIQRFYRGFMVRQELIRIEHCVIVLQSLWRMKRAKHVVAEMRLQKEREVKENIAAVAIQKYYRGFMVRQELIRIEQCVKLLQSLWRMKRAKRVVSEMRLQKEREVKENIAAVTIQKCYRGFIVRKEQKHMEKCAMILQSLWRMKRAKRVVAEMRLRKEREVKENIAAVTIQKCYRGFIVRKEQKHMEKCAMILQSLWRMKRAKQVFAEMRLQKEREVKENIAAVTIQKCYRGFIVRKEQKHMEKCAMILQSLWRMKRAKRVVAEMKLEKEREVREKFAAVRIQKCYRGFKVRKEVRCMNKYATVLQCFWRVHLAKKVFRLRWQKRELEVKKEKCAVTLQKYFKGWLCRREMGKVRDAAICVQKNWRGYQGRKRASIVLKQLQIDSAVIIQKWARGWICRQRFKQTREAAICIQRMWRAFLIGQYLEQEEEKRQSAALVIQAWYRKCAQQQIYQTLKSEVIFVQRKYRGILKGREVREDLRKKYAAITIQKAWRQLVVIREAKSILKEKKEIKSEKERQRKFASAVMIQTCYRGYKCRQDFGNMKLACVKVQSLWRMFKAKMILQDFREEKMERAKEIVYKTVVAFYHFSQFQKTKEAAIVIQKNRRMILAVRQFSLLKHLRNEKAAICIQKTYKAYVARSHFLTLKKSAVTLQMHWRCFLIQKELIQMQMKRNERERAACVLQAFIRGAIQRRNFLRVKNAVAVLQELYHKNFLARQKTEKDAATVIQSAFRGYLCCRRYRAQKEAAVVIQNWFRRSQMAESERMKFLESRSCAVTIQSYCRMYRERKEFLRKREAVVKLQAFARRIQAEERYHLKRNASLIIQMYFRAWKTGKIFRQAYVLIRDSCIIIQRFYRREKSRKERVQKYLAMQSAVKVIQIKYRSILKGRQVRADLKIRKEAVITIQNSWRRFIMIKEAKNILEEKREKKHVEEERQEEKTRNDAAVIVQRSWRRLKIMHDAKREMEDSKKRKMQMEQELKDERLRNDAALVIQQAYKEYKMIREAKVLLKQKRDDARRAEQRRNEEEQQRKEQMRKEEEAATMRKEEEAATIIQRAWIQFRLTREACVILERLREEAKLLKEEKVRSNAASLIQQTYKQFKLMQEAKRVLEKRREARRVEEEKWRRKEEQANAVAVRLEQEHLAAVTIQRRWRHVLEVRKAKSVMEKDGENATFLVGEDCEMRKEEETLKESKQRSESVEDDEAKKNDEMAKEIMDAEEFDKKDEQKGMQEEKQSELEDEELRQVKASEIIQRNVRAFLKCQQETRRVRAATVIQKYFRGYNQRCEFLKIMQAIIVIQSRVRTLICRKKFEVYKASVCLIQQRWRERNTSQQLRKEFLCKVKAVCVIQSWYRLARGKKRERAAVTIQALWRGHKVRRNLKCKKLKAARKRLQEANRSGNKNTLGSRTASALEYLLANNDMAYILSALMNLEVSTRLASVCCERLVEANAVTVLVKLLSSCNRSVPHMEIIKYTTDILLNLAIYDKTVDSLMEVHNITSVVLNIMQIFREKGAIFYKSCALLGTLAKDPNRRQIMLKCPQLIDRVRSMHSLALRKQRTNDKRQQKTPAKSKVITKEFNDPLTAIHFVLSSLQLDSKH